MNKPVKLIILIEVQVGKAQLQIDLYNKIKHLVLAEKGCLQYEMNQVVANQEQFVLIECWQSMADLAIHDNSEHMQAADLLSRTFRAKAVTVLSLTALNENE